MGPLFKCKLELRTTSQSKSVLAHTCYAIGRNQR